MFFLKNENENENEENFLGYLEVIFELFFSFGEHSFG